MSKRWLMMTGLLSLTATFGCGKAESYEKPLTPVKAATIDRQTLSGGGARYSANLQPETLVELAFKTGGHVQELLRVGGRFIEEGDFVARGTVLARLRDADVAARLKQAQANLTEAQAAQTQVKVNLAEAEKARDQLKIELDRATRLLESESLIMPEYEAAKSKFEMSRARVEAVKAQLSMTNAKEQGARGLIEEIESARDDSRLIAPINGLVLKRNIEVGAFAAPGAPAFTLADVSSIKAVFGTPDVVAMGLKPGTILTVTSEAMRGDEFRGRLTHIAPAADPKTRVFDVEVKIPNPRRRLKVGMVVSLQGVGEHAPETVSVAPLAALIQLKEKEAGYGLFVIEDQNGKQIARLRRVKLGETLGNLIAVTEGAQAGERVVVSGATMISDGEQVRIVP